MHINNEERSISSCALHTLDRTNERINDVVPMEQENLRNEFLDVLLKLILR